MSVRNFVIGGRKEEVIGIKAGDFPAVVPTMELRSQCII